MRGRVGDHRAKKSAVPVRAGAWILVAPGEINRNGAGVAVSAVPFRPHFREFNLELQKRLLKVEIARPLTVPGVADQVVERFLSRRHTTTPNYSISSNASRKHSTKPDEFGFPCEKSVSLALDFLRAHLEHQQISQAEFARRCDMTPANFSEVINGTVALSARNLERLLRGFKDEQDQLEFLAAYLRDEIPKEYADRIEVSSGKRSFIVEEGAAGDADLVANYSALPTKKLREAVQICLRQLRIDSEFRALFVQTMNYMIGDDADMFNAANAKAKARVEAEQRADAARASRT